MSTLSRKISLTVIAHEDENNLKMSLRALKGRGNLPKLRLSLRIPHPVIPESKMSKHYNVILNLFQDLHVIASPERARQSPKTPTVIAHEGENNLKMSLLDPLSPRQSPKSPTVIAHTSPCHSGIEEEQAAKPSRSTC